MNLSLFRDSRNQIVDHKNSTFNEAALKKAGCSEQAIDPLRKMCHPNCKGRITAEEAEDVINNLISHGGNKVMERL